MWLGYPYPYASLPNMVTRHHSWPGRHIVCLVLALITWQGLVAPSAPAASTTILISEVQVRGSLSPTDEFIELYNAGDNPIDLNGYRLYYQDAAASSGTLYFHWVSETVIPPYHHLLLARVRSGSSGYDGIVSADGYFSLGIGDHGSLALYDPNGLIVDSVGWGTVDNAYVEGSPAPQPGPEGSIERLPGGSAGNGTDTDDNASDFVLRSVPAPQNLASLPTCPTCPTATPTLTPTATPTPSETPTLKPTRTPTVTRSPTPSKTHTATKSPTPSRTHTTTRTRTPTPTATPFVGSIEGWVFVDNNGNGVREPWLGETGGIDGVTIILLLPDHTRRVKVTAGGGFYSFGGIQAPGTYTITEIQPAGYVSTSPDALVLEPAMGQRNIDNNFGERAATPTPTPTATPGPTSYPPGAVLIYEIAYDALAGGNDAAYEWFELHNRTHEPVSLNGWTIADNSARDTLPALMLPADGFVVIAARIASFLEDYPDFAGVIGSIADGRIGNGLANTGDRLLLYDPTGHLIDALSYGDDASVFNPPAPGVVAGHSLEREPGAPDTDTAADFVDRAHPSPGGTPQPTPTATMTPTATATASPTVTSTASPPASPTSPPSPTPTPLATETETAIASPTPTRTASATPTATALASATPSPTPTPTPAPALPLLISEFLYDGLSPDSEGDEFVEIYNPLTVEADLSGYKIGDEEKRGGNEGMYVFPAGARLASGQVVVVAKNGEAFRARFGFAPDYELALSGSDAPEIPNLVRYTAWGRGSWSLSNQGDEIILLGPQDEVVDAVAYGQGDFAAVGLAGRLKALAPDSAQRVAAWDHADMTADFAVDTPTPGRPLLVPEPVAIPPVPMPGGMFAYFGALRGQSNYANGRGPALYAWAIARSYGLHFLALSEDDGALDQASWQALGWQAKAATVPGAFVALRAFEMGPRDRPHLSSDGTQSYTTVQDFTAEASTAWLLAHPEALAIFAAPDPGGKGEPDAFPYDPEIAPQLAALEVGHGVGEDYRRYEAAYRRALASGWRVAPVGNADDDRAWGGRSPLRTGLVAAALTEGDLLGALRARRVFVTEDDNLTVALRAGETWMGSVISPTTALVLSASFSDPEAEPLALELWDREVLLARKEFTDQAQGVWQIGTVGAAGHHLFLRAVQADGDLAFTAPIWIAGEAAPDIVLLNEVLSSPRDVDWDGDGEANATDEWVELYNPGLLPIALAGWQLSDTSAGPSYTIPPGTVLPADGFLVLYRRETRLALNTSNETVTLHRPDGSIADAFHYDRFAGWDQSWCRTEDGAGTWMSECEATPGGPNRLRPAAPPPPPPRRVTVAQARALSEGAEVIIEGQVTAPPPYFGRSIYVQDGTGGLNVYLVHGGWPDLSEGEQVRVVGRLDDVRGERQVRIVNATFLTRLGAAEPLRPQRVRSGEVGESFEGMLVLIFGQVIDLQPDAMILDDGSGPARVYVRESTGWHRPRLHRGEWWAAVGVVSQYGTQRPYTDGHRLLPRYPADLYPAPPPLLLPETGALSPPEP